MVFAFLMFGVLVVVGGGILTFRDVGTTESGYNLLRTGKLLEYEGFVVAWTIWATTMLLYLRWGSAEDRDERRTVGLILLTLLITDTVADIVFGVLAGTGPRNSRLYLESIFNSVFVYTLGSDFAVTLGISVVSHLTRPAMRQLADLMGWDGNATVPRRSERTSAPQRQARPQRIETSAANLFGSED